MLSSLCPSLAHSLSLSLKINKLKKNFFLKCENHGLDDSKIGTNIYPNSQSGKPLRIQFQNSSSIQGCLLSHPRMVPF